MDVVWETETTSHAGIVTNYYYCYILVQSTHGGAQDINGSANSNVVFIHPTRRSFLVEDVAWNAAYGWYDGEYNYVCVQAGNPDNPNSKQIAIPVNTGPGPLALRDEYLINVLTNWYPATSTLPVLSGLAISMKAMKNMKAKPNKALKSRSVKASLPAGGR